MNIEQHKTKNNYKLMSNCVYNNNNLIVTDKNNNSNNNNSEKKTELDKLGGNSNLYYLILNELMTQSYFNWNLQEADFIQEHLLKKLPNRKDFSYIVY